MDETPKQPATGRLRQAFAAHRMAFIAFGVLLVAVGAILASTSEVRTPSRTPAGPSPTPGQPFVFVRQTGDLGTLAGTPEKVKAEAGAQLKIFLRDFYERAFVGAASAPENLVAPQALGAFTAQRDAFTNGSDVAVAHGRVDFSGLLYTSGDRVLGALIKVSFSAEGRFTAPPERLARLAEHGQLLLQPTPEGWRLSGFDVILNVDSAPTAASPSPQAMGIAARWMP